jgi:hypothetical protein
MLRMANVGLKDIRVETVTEKLEFQSGKHMWDLVTSSNPIGAALVADLTEEQRAVAQQALDGMLRQRSGERPRRPDQPGLHRHRYEVKAPLRSAAGQRPRFVNGAWSVIFASGRPVIKVSYPGSNVRPAGRPRPAALRARSISSPRYAPCFQLSPRPERFQKPFGSGARLRTKMQRWKWSCRSLPGRSRRLSLPSAPRLCR